MTTSGVNPEGFPQGGEFVDEAITLQSRFPQINMPRDTMWPLRLHDEATKAVVAEVLPELVTALSEPIKPATKNQIHDIFATNPHKRRLPWHYKEDGEGLTYTTGAYEGQTDAKGSTPLYDGINYQFDANGRMVKFELIEGEHSYNRHRPRYQEFLTYDNEGYLTERLTWGYIEPTITDRFEYTVDEAGRKTPAKMTRTQKVQGEDSEPMTVDLANYEEWLMTNPNGISALTREQLDPKELEITDFNVSEYRKGILFAHPEQLEHALVMYGDGSYPTPGGETALEYNDKAFADAHGSLGGALFSLAARSGDMREFVSNRITSKVQDKWNQLQKKRAKATSESVHFGFDYDGAGHFHKTNGEVEITKDGVGLTLSAAYAGDQVEDQLASALGMKRGLRNATIEIPVNQTERDGYFFVDVKAVCDKLGIPVSEQDVADYLEDYLGDKDDAPKAKYQRYSKYGSRQPAIWQDEATGVSVILETERRDYDSSADLDNFFGHDGTSVWGPLPKEVRRTSDSKKNTPKIRIVVEPVGDPFDEATTQRTDVVVRTYMSRLEQSAA
ncbi:hypothetical protein A3F37_00530 [Candidatus Saccharibacteria bacterium RIFCSPHIGHO2_12_FULL_41_12]|nr:MAG: hypothetical protein A3F37_00530 [Candidatus Saccharibacteria bacterium RIFCSPHIGHO2_12_FULL_41_12]